MARASCYLRAIRVLGEYKLRSPEQLCLRPPIQGPLVHADTMERLPYDSPWAEATQLIHLGPSLLVSFSVEGEFEELEDGGEL